MLLKKVQLKGDLAKKLPSCGAKRFGTRWNLRPVTKASRAGVKRVTVGPLWPTMPAEKHTSQRRPREELKLREGGTPYI